MVCVYRQWMGSWVAMSPINFFYTVPIAVQIESMHSSVLLSVVHLVQRFFLLLDYLFTVSTNLVFTPCRVSLIHNKSS